MVKILVLIAIVTFIATMVYGMNLTESYYNFEGPFYKNLLRELKKDVEYSKEHMTRFGKFVLCLKLIILTPSLICWMVGHVITLGFSRISKAMYVN